MKLEKTQLVQKVIYFKLVNSADPYILNNIIEKNYGNGITSVCNENLRCDGKIRNNEILGNMENGIECCGNNNFTRIDNNTIMYNLKAGVRCD